MREAKKKGWKQPKRMKNNRGEKRKREEEKEENSTETVKRRCQGCVSVEAFEIFSQGKDSESCGGLSWEDLLEKPQDFSDFEPDTRAHVRVVPDVTDVPVSPSSVVISWNLCWAQTTRRWILEELWKKQGTKMVARYLRPSAQMVRVNSWWSVVRDGTSTKGG